MWKVLLQIKANVELAELQFLRDPSEKASTYQKAVSVWKLMVSRTCSGALSSSSSMMKMR